MHFLQERRPCLSQVPIALLPSSVCRQTATQLRQVFDTCDPLSVMELPGLLKPRSYCWSACPLRFLLNPTLSLDFKERPTQPSMTRALVARSSEVHCYQCFAHWLHLLQL